MSRVSKGGGLGVAIVALVLSAASSTQAADHPFLATALTLCRPNHSRAADVMTAAEHDGWSPLRLTTGGSVGAKARAKTIDGKRQKLIVFTMPFPLGGGATAVGHACQVGSDAPIGDLAASVRTTLGRGPTADTGSFAVWIFTEREGHRVFLPDASPGGMAAALKTGPVEIVNVPSNGLALMYIEVTSAP